MCIYYKALGFDPFAVAIPITFHIKSQNDPEYTNFVKKYNELQSKSQQNVWIVKPGENSNRGCGIEVANKLSEIK